MFYIFLDIDGVLNRSSDWKKMYTLNTECIRRFADFVKHLKREVNIVLTSSWRTGFSYNQRVYRTGYEKTFATIKVIKEEKTTS